MKKAALYCRVSTEEQARHGQSIDSQLETLRKYAQENKYKTVGEYIDEGVSGQKTYKKRPALSKLLDSLDGVDTILFIRLDRWTRSVRNYYEIQDILDAHHVTWRAVLEDYETETSSGIFKVNIMLSVAQAEAQRTGEKIKDVFANKKARGEICSGSTAIGLKIIDKKIVADPEEAPKVVALFHKYIEMKSRSGLCRYALNTYGTSHSTYGMKYLLTNHKYVEAGIISQALFDEVQEILARRSARTTDKNSNTPNVNHLFTGIFFCAECRSTMRNSTAHGCIMYSCGRHSRFGDEGCKNSSCIVQNKVEKKLLERIPEVAREHNINCHTVDVNAVKLDINRLKTKAKRLQDLYINELIELDDYKVQYEDIQRQIKEMEVPRETIPIDYDSMITMLGAYDSLNMENKKRFWNRIAKRITFDKDRNIDVDFSTAEMLSITQDT